MCLFKLFAIIDVIVIILIIVFIEIIDIIVLIVWCCQLRIDLSIPVHIWANKRAAIAKQVDDMGDEFRPAMRKGWLAYITKTYAADPAVRTVSIGQGALVVADDDC